MTFIRVMMLIPMLRLFMLCEEPDDLSLLEARHEISYDKLDELVTLYAQAMLHMNALGWSVGGYHRIYIGQRLVRTGRFGRTYTEPTYETHFGKTMFPDMLLTRKGAIYRNGKILDLEKVDGYTRNNLIAGLRKILATAPQPTHL